MDLKNAAVLVTGGSCGIGLETARLLRARGARVAICARHQDILEAAAKEIGALPIIADVSKEDDVLRMMTTVVKEYSDYNVLINNAGFGSFKPLLETTLDEMRDVFATNVFGAMMVARETA
ncbi:MAG TPA: SDR family NAD(P)-dependent oxidoreductase, partial [Gemmatimonadaceae bacterium]